ncbi:MAG: transposase, partial [Actinomycetota bacterium]|nr:transposase [Actinomycetota bacterium]
MGAAGCVGRHDRRAGAWLAQSAEARCGIDLGIGTEWAVIAHADDTIERIAHPAPWVQTHKLRRRVARQRSRRMVGSRGHRQANAKLAALDRRAANLRTQSVHTVSTRLARRYGTIVVEDLDLVAIGRGMGRRAFRRSVAQAGIGRIRPTLADKCAWGGGELQVADRWFPWSRTHHGCGGYRSDLQLHQRVWGCPLVGSWWTATPTRPAISVTGPDRSPTGMSSGVELPPRCRWWATTAGRLTHRVGVRGPRRPPRGGGGLRHHN